jgi:Papain-like cysteine protease AvrRpt2
MAQIDFDVQGTIPVIAQPKSMACWATVTTMMLSWQKKQSFTIETAMDSLGSDFRKVFDDNTGLFPNRVQELATASGMTVEYQKCETPQSILSLLQNFGPISIIDNEVPSDSQPTFIHARIIKGIHGDGTATGTTLNIIDPDGGKTYDETFDVFSSKYESMSNANGWNLQMMHFPASANNTAGNNSPDNSSNSTGSSDNSSSNSSTNNSSSTDSGNSTSSQSTSSDSGNSSSSSTSTGSTDNTASSDTSSAPSSQDAPASNESSTETSSGSNN